MRVSAIILLFLFLHRIVDGAELHSPSCSSEAETGASLLQRKSGMQTMASEVLTEDDASPEITEEAFMKELAPEMFKSLDTDASGGLSESEVLKLVTVDDDSNAKSLVQMPGIGYICKNHMAWIKPSTPFANMCAQYGIYPPGAAPAPPPPPPPAPAPQTRPCAGKIWSYVPDYIHAIDNDKLGYYDMNKFRENPNRCHESKTWFNFRFNREESVDWAGTDGGCLAASKSCKNGANACTSTDTAEGCAQACNAEEDCVAFLHTTSRTGFSAIRLEGSCVLMSKRTLGYPLSHKHPPQNSYWDPAAPPHRCAIKGQTSSLTKDCLKAYSASADTFFKKSTCR